MSTQFEEVQVHNRGSKRLFREQKESLLAKGWEIDSEDHAQATLIKKRRTKPPPRITRSKSSGKSSKSKK